MDKNTASSSKDSTDEYFECITECEIQDDKCTETCVSNHLKNDPQLDVHSY